MKGKKAFIALPVSFPEKQVDTSVVKIKVLEHLGDFSVSGIELNLSQQHL